MFKTSKVCISFALNKDQEKIDDFCSRSNELLCHPIIFVSLYGYLSLLIDGIFCRVSALMTCSLMIYLEILLPEVIRWYVCWFKFFFTLRNYGSSSCWGFVKFFLQTIFIVYDCWWLHIFMLPSIKVVSWDLKINEKSWKLDTKCTNVFINHKKMMKKLL